MIKIDNIKYPAIKSLITEKDGLYSLTIKPLLPGFGHTLGNSLRRVLLSSIPGFSLTTVRINNITHEYQAVDGVVEDALDIILNLKNLKAKITSDAEKATLVLNTSNEGDIFIKDFQKNAEIEIVNPDLYVCHLNKGSDLQIEVDIERGVGYQPISGKELSQTTNPTDILVDKVFSPIENVSFKVDQIRVGDNTNYESVKITFNTDGTVNGYDVIDFAFGLNIEMFQNMKSALQVSQNDVVEEVLVQKSSDEINLPPRLKRILENNDILTNEQLKARVGEVPDFSGVGEKAIREIEDYVKGL